MASATVKADAKYGFEGQARLVPISRPSNADENWDKSVRYAISSQVAVERIADYEPSEIFLSIANRYIQQQLIASFATLCLFFTLVALGNYLTMFTEKAVAGQLPREEVMAIVLLRLPEVLQLVIPICSFLALTYTLSRLHASQELTALLSLGLTVNRLLIWLAPSVVMVATGVALLTFLVTPSARDHLDQSLTRAQGQAALVAFRPGEFFSFDAGDVVTFTGSTDANNLKNLFIRQQLPQNQQLLIWAAAGKRTQVEASGEQSLQLSDGHQYQWVPGQLNPQIMSFKTLEIRLPATVQLRQKDYQPELEGRKTFSLGESAEERGELYWRIALPLFTLVGALLAIGVSYVRPRQDAMATFPRALAYLVAYYLAITASRWWVEQQVVPDWLSFSTVHVAFLLLGWRTLNVLRRPADPAR